MKEKIIKTKSCKQCSDSFDITDRDIEFYRQVSPVIAGVKHDIPAPEKCPDCRMQNRMSFRNERKLFKRKCNATGKEIISMYTPENTLKIYHQDIWLWDSWDALDYGIDVDFSRSIFDQFSDLQKEVPVPALYSYFGTNSDYCNCANYQKNCYLTFACSKDEDSMYSGYINDSKDCLDCLMVFDCENCYSSVDLKNCFNMKYCKNSSDCSDCLYSIDLINCKHCFGCTNLVWKSYCFENTQLTKEEYEDKIANIKDYKMPTRDIAKFMSGNMNENSTGNYMTNTKNTQHSFDVNNLEDCKYNIWFHDSKNCYDTYSWWQNSENCYECVAMGDNCMNLAFCANVFLNSSNSMYSMFCMSIKDCFGCIGLKNAEYCIFNKQYTKEEYESLAPKIIEKMKQDWEWWEAFPVSMSTFPYTSTVASDYYPLKKSEAIDIGYSWSDYENPIPKVEKIIPANKLPENISDVPDDILNWAVECESTWRPFRIIKPELKFYRKHNLPIPKRHPDQRIFEKIQSRNPRKLYERNCAECSLELSTTYSPERPGKLLCESCYNKKVY